MDHTQVLNTVLAANKVGATQHERAMALQVFDQLKSGDVRTSAASGADLTQPQQPLEAQIMGYALLQHLVGNRWEDFSPEETQHMTTLAYNLLRQSAHGGPWVIRSKAALLLALVIKRSGAEFLEVSFGQLLGLAAEGPAVQEVVCMVIKYVGDEIMQFPDDVQGEARRSLMQSLKKTLQPVLTFLEQTLESNYAAATTPAVTPGATAPLAHAAAIQAALAAAATYAEWAPLGSLRDAGLLAACGFLLGGADYRTAACEVLRQAVGRKQEMEEPAAFEGAQGQMALDLSKAAAVLVAPGALKELDYEGANDEFGQLLCETMTVLGSTHLSGAGLSQEERLSFLGHMLTFAQHPYLLLADKALTMWAKLLQEAATATLNAANHPGKPATLPLPTEAVLALMALAAEQLQQRGPHVPQEEEDVPMYFDSFEDYRDFMVNYRARLSLIVRSAAGVLPEPALNAAVERLTSAVAATKSETTRLEDKRRLLESAVLFMEAALKAIWDTLPTTTTTNNDPSKNPQAVAAATEPMLHHLLSLTVSDPPLLLAQARGLEGFTKLLNIRRDLLPSVLSRLFEILLGSIRMEVDGREVPPGKPPAGWRERLQARNQVATVILIYARSCPEAFLPHLEGLASRAKELWESGQLRPAEINTINEGVLAASIAGPPGLQASVAEWVLGPIRTAWSDPAFQATLNSPEAFITQYVLPIGGTAAAPEVGGAAARWTLYHQVHLIERALRSTHKVQVSTSVEAVAAVAAGGVLPSAPVLSSTNPLGPHMQWALPVLFKLLSCLQSLWSPACRASLGPAESALDISPQEKALYLKRTGPGKRAVARNTGSGDGGRDNNDVQTGDYATVGGTTVPSLRAWVRHIREYALQTIGMLPTHCPAGLELPTTAPALAPAVLSYMDCLDNHHLRLVLRHCIIPYVRHCPVRFIHSCLIPLLALLTPHMQQRLPAVWGSVAGINTTGEDSNATDEEILRDRMVRELTQEYADLLKELAARQMDDVPRLPSASQTIPGSQKAQQKGGGGGLASQAGGGGSQSGGPPPKMLFETLLELEGAAGIAAATAAVDGIRCPDESSYRFAMFCRTLVLLGPRDANLYGYVGSEVLRAAIGSLASEIMSTHQADVLSLIRDILAQQLGNPGSNVHNVLCSLPGVGQEREQEFAKALLATGSEKEQRNLIKALLVGACGRGSFAALADWKPPSTVTLSGVKVRGARTGDSDPSTENLQGEITRALFS